jgi:dCTP deaminase
LPDDVLARILAKGQLFSIGIVPVNTYADPGFRGRLGITLFNASHRHLVIKPGQEIAKIEFMKLNRPVSKPYSGQHGYETRIWPIPTHLYASRELLEKQHIQPHSLGEIERSYGPVVSSLEGRLRSYERKIWVQIFLTVAFFAAIFSVAGRVDWSVSIALGILANLTTNLFAFGLKSLFRR